MVVTPEDGYVRIVYLHQYFATPQMSTGTRSYEMARRLVQRGHEVHMIASRTDSQKVAVQWDHELVAGIRVHWLPVPYANAMGTMRRILAFAQFATLAADHAARLRPDVVFATSTPLTIAIPGAYASMRRQVPMVFEVRDLWPELPRAVGALTNKPALALATWLERQAYRRSRKVIALSAGMAEGIARTGYPRTDIATIPNGCDLTAFNVDESAGQAFRAARPWLGDRPLVLYCGALGRINNVSYLVELAGQLLPLAPEVRFLIMGRGGQEQLVRENARRLGVLDVNLFMEQPIPKSAVPAAMNAATVCTSLFLPLSAMEANSANKFFDALAAGRPIAINYGGWQKELILDNDCGIVLGADPDRQVAGQLLDLLADPDRLHSMGTAARSVGVNQFDRDVLARQFIEVIESCGPAVGDS